MKFVIVLAAVVACVLAAPVDESQAVVESFDSNISPDGNFQASYKTSNSISAIEQGRLLQTVDQENKPLGYLVKSGEYSWVDTEGKQHSIKWEADQDGYRAYGDDIPKAA